MKAFLILSFIFGLACNNAPSPSSSDTINAGAQEKSNTYFKFDVDGKSFDIKDENISSAFHEYNDHTEFKIFAGADGSTSLTLTVIASMKGPSSTPSGSPEPGNPLGQGSVSLQNFPETGTTNNSYDFLDGNKSQPVADAIVITAIEPAGKDASYITGTISTTTVASANDPLKKTHKITGKFRIRHQFSGGDRF